MVVPSDDHHTTRKTPARRRSALRKTTGVLQRQEATLIWRISTQLVLLGLFGAYGWVLVERAAPHSSPGGEQRAIAANDRLQFVAGPGVDRSGQLVVPTKEPAASRVVAFLLRESTLAEDLRFWSLVAGLIATHSGVRIVAYCEGKACLASLDRLKQEVPFTVIGYAGMIDAQAILNADARGEFVIKDLAESESSSRVKWRETGQTPVLIAKVVTP